MKILIASDNYGFDLKNFIKQIDFSNILNENIEFIDLGVHSGIKCNYTDVVKQFIKIFKKEIPFRKCAKQKTLGILIGKTGNEMSIVANKYSKIRAVVCCSEKESILAREEYNANILCIGSLLIDKNTAIEIITSFLSTNFVCNKYSKQIKTF